MSDQPRVPADMLLLAERQRRAGQRVPAPEATTTSEIVDDPGAMEPLAESVVEELLDDTLVADAAARSAEHRAALSLYRPLGQVSLAALHWSATVDHEALQTAIVCCPVGSAAGGGLFEQSLVAVLPMTLPARPEGVPTLHVTLSADDIAAVEYVVRHATRPAGLRLVRAAALPTSIAGAEPVSSGLATAALSSYRTAALVHAWNAGFGAPAAQDLERDRDAAAVNLLSTLRGLLGET